MKKKKEGIWNLNSIYEGTESTGFSNDIEWLEKLTESFKRRIKSKKADFSRIVSDYNLISDLFETLSAYTSSLFSTNTSDKSIVLALNKVESLSANFNVCTTLFYKFVSDNKKERMLFLKKHPDYAFVFSEIVEKAKHSLNSEMTELASDLMRNGSTLFSKLQDSISSSASVAFTEDDSKKEMKTVTELRALLGSEDRALREKAFNLELGIWKTHEISLAYALNSVKGTTLLIEKRTGWDSPIKHSCFDSRISDGIFNSLITVLENSIPMFRTYLKTKAKALNLKKLAFFDLSAPVNISSGELKNNSYDLIEAKKIIIENFTKFNPIMGEFAVKAFDNNWIDAYPYPNKTGGAYDVYFPKVRESRIFANFDGTYDGVSTLAHELGHAWHDKVISKKSNILRRYPMTLAETASIFSEFIVFKGTLENLSDDQKLPILEQFIQNSCQVCLDILCRYYFEEEVFKRRKESELLPSELCEIMIKCQKKTYGDALDSSNLHPYMWAVKSHYYSTDFSFYNYPYAFGQLFGLGLYSKSQNTDNSEPFYKTFNFLLSLTGTLSVKDVALSVGINLEDISFWQEGINVILSYISLFKKIVNKYV